MRSARPRRRAGAAGAWTPDASGAGRRRLRHRGGPVLAVLLAAVLTACGGDTPSMLDPRSDDARRVEGLWWVLFWISCAVVAVVTGFLLAAARRRRAELHVDDDIDRRPVPWGDRFVVIAGAAIPGGILAGSFAFSLAVLNDMGSADDRPLEVEVVGHTWWWEVRYPNGAVTANEIRIPVGETVELALPTADVIHSFWVPELQVKKDHIPGADNRLSVVADHAGRFRGQCAEFCGLQHAHMEIMVEAMPAGEFDDWLRREAGPAPEPDGAEAEDGRQIFERASCAGCHTIRGTSAEGTLGPDLTHLANRQTLGAGVVPFTPEALDDFITDPQDDKPGVSMPPTELTPDQVDAVVAYLTELE